MFIYLLLLIAQCHRAGKSNTRMICVMVLEDVQLRCCILECCRALWGSRHHTARDRERVCVCVHALISLLIKKPYSTMGIHPKDLSNPDHLPKALLLNTIVELSQHLNTSRCTLNFTPEACGRHTQSISKPPHTV